MTGQRPKLHVNRSLGVFSVAMLSVVGPLVPALASERLDNRVAVFSALDKVTATIKELAVPINETVEFGALKVTPRVCYSRPPTEQPKTTSFVEVEEVSLEGGQKRIFSGWMFAQSPGINAVEHPVFDVWLTDCREPRNSVAQRPPPAAAPGGAEAESDAYVVDPFDEPADMQRRRVRR